MLYRRDLHVGKPLRGLLLAMEWLVLEAGDGGREEVGEAEGAAAPHSPGPAAKLKRSLRCRGVTVALGEDATSLAGGVITGRGV